MTLILVGFASGSSARAQASLSGSWRAGATSIDVTIESWGPDCGPRPQSTRSSGGGVVTIEQKNQALVLHGRDQNIRSDACWSRNPAMKRNTASYADGSWVTRCRTAADDPRAEQGTYTLKLLKPDTLQYQDVSHYDWALNESRCIATFSTTQTLTRTDKKADTSAARPAPQRIEPPPEVPAPPAEQERACTPGSPLNLTLRPRRADVEVGQRICFRLRVTDASDCAIPDPNVEWSLSHSKALRGTLNGNCFTPADTVAEAEGEFRVQVKLGKLQTESIVSVHAIDLSGVMAKRMLGGGLTGFDESDEPVTSAPKAVARISTQTSTDTQGGGMNRVLIAALGVLAAALAGLGWWFSRRAKPAAVSGRRAGRSSRSVITESGSDAVRAIETNGNAVRSAASAPAEVTNEPWICPTCRVGYPAHQGTCPKDGSALMPYAQFAQRGRQKDQERSKRCPVCGQSFPANASFCSSDGASLVDD